MVGVLVNVVVKWWRVYGHFFVSVKYLRSRGFGGVLRRIAYLDEGLLARLRGSPFLRFVRPMFSGGFICLCWSWTMGELVLQRFSSARVDARGFVEDLLAPFRVLF